MNYNKVGFFILLAILTLQMLVLAGCGKSKSDGPTMENIPVYPNVEIGQSMQQKIPGGFMGGSLKQYTTTGSFDDIVDYYTNALQQYDTEVMSHTSELGQQTAISIHKENGVITVAIQEFVEQQAVNITFMEVGR